jgi:cysteine desulfurase
MRQCGGPGGWSIVEPVPPVLPPRVPDGSGAMPFFDHINGAPPLPEAVRAMAAWLGPPANPQAGHGPGRRAHMAVEAARAQVAALIGADPAEVVFGATGSEVNNLAVKGFLKANRRKGRHVVLSAVEDPSVDRACRRMADDGCTVTVAPVDREGQVDPAAVAEAMVPGTALVCLQLANPEMGAVQPVAEVAGAARSRGAVVLVDAVFAAGRMAVDVAALGADLLTLSAPGVWGPPGAAALFARRGLRLQPEVDGGVQERGLRGGLENVPAIAGFGAACHHLAQGREAHLAHLERLAGRLREGLLGIPGVRLTGPEGSGTGGPRAAGHVSVLVPGVEGESLLALLDAEGIAASSGSYCGAKAMKASPVLTAMGYPPEAAACGVAFSLGPQNTAEEVDQGVLGLRKCLERIKGALAGGAPGQARGAPPGPDAA